MNNFGDTQYISHSKCVKSYRKAFESARLRDLDCNCSVVNKASTKSTISKIVNKSNKTVKNQEMDAIDPKIFKFLHRQISWHKKQPCKVGKYEKETPIPEVGNFWRFLSRFWNDIWYISCPLCLITQPLQDLFLMDHCKWTKR